MLSHFPPDTIGGARKAVLTLLGPGGTQLLCSSPTVNQLNLGTHSLGCARRRAAEPKGTPPWGQECFRIWRYGLGFKFPSMSKQSQNNNSTSNNNNNNKKDYHTPNASMCQVFNMTFYISQQLCTTGTTVYFFLTDGITKAYTS